MIKLETLEIENFGIFKDVKLDFGDKEVIGILAEYKCDKNRSNMAGKTTISEAIRYNLIGCCRYRKEVKMIHYGESMMKVTCVYIDDEGKKYKVVRGRDIKNNGVLELDWIEKSRESQSAINDIFGISKDDFDITSFFKQADINGFMDKSPAEKTAYLQKAMNNDHWKEKEDMVKEDVKALNITLKENEAVKKALEESIEPDEPLKAEITEITKDSKIADKNIYAKNKALNTLSEQLENDKKHNWKTNEKMKNLQKEIESSQLVANKKGKLKARIKADKKKLEELEEEVIDFDETIEDLISERTTLKSVLESKTETLESPNNSGVCPLLNESCDRIKLSESDRKALSAGVIKTRERIKEVNTLITSIKSNDSVKTLVKDLKVSLKNNMGRYKDIEVSDPKAIEDQIDELRSSLIEIDIESEEEIQSLGKEIEELSNKVTSNSNKLTVLNHRIVQAEKALNQINDIYDKNEKLVKKLEHLKYISMMFGRSGILADEIENAFEEIQDDINYILKELDCGLTVSFSPDKELNKKESVCSCGFVYYKNYKKPVCEGCGVERRNARKDEISLQILDGNGNEADFEGGSGGQKSIISYAVRIALTMFKKRQNQCQLNMLFLDEVDSALDSHLATAITDSITKVLTKKLGYSQILMVSHKDEIKHSVPNIIKVVKNDSYSTAKFV